MLENSIILQYYSFLAQRVKDISTVMFQIEIAPTTALRLQGQWRTGPKGGRWDITVEEVLSGLKKAENTSDFL